MKICKVCEDRLPELRSSPEFRMTENTGCPPPGRPWDYRRQMDLSDTIARHCIGWAVLIDFILLTIYLVQTGARIY